MELRERKPHRADATNAAPSEITPDQSRRTSRGMSFRSIVSKLLFGVFFIYCILPLCFYNSQWLRQHIVFLTFMSNPTTLNLSEPAAFKFECAQNTYIESEPGLKLGTWYLQTSQIPCFENQKPFQDSDRTVVLYLHGNAGTRGGHHRVELYKLLTDYVGVNVVAFDYRGYGDSSSHIRPSVDGLVHDALQMYKHLRQTIPAHRIVIWGHSLGTGVATYLSAELNKLKDNPAGLVLESPFDELANVVKFHPLSRVHRIMPFFQQIFVDSVKNDPTTGFNSIEKSKYVSKDLPLMILHAKDDAVIPFKLAERLYSTFKSHRVATNSRLEFLQFEAELGYGHKYIYTHKGLGDTLKEFFQFARANKDKLEVL